MWLVLTLFSFAGFLISLAAFIWRGLDRAGRLRRAGWPILVVAGACFALWCFSLPRVPPPYDLKELRGVITPP